MLATFASRRNLESRPLIMPPISPAINLHQQALKGQSPASAARAINRDALLRAGKVQQSTPAAAEQANTTYAAKKGLICGGKGGYAR